MSFAQTVLLADTWGMHGDDWGAGWMVVMIVLMVVFWAAVILGIVWLVRGGATGNWSLPARGSETPTDILARRFAEGAISAEEYRERREVIAKGARQGSPKGG